jgi:transcription antitermination factor NusG
MHTGCEMPTLALEPCVFPPDLFGVGSSSLDDGCWWVYHTRPRAEKALARALLQRQIAFFLPLMPKSRKHNGRLFISHLPLFSGYVFMHGDNAARIRALTTNLIARALQVPDQSELTADLARIHRLMATGASLLPEERLVPGSGVRIISGPLAGLDGKILRRGKRLRLHVEVHFLQRGASVELEHWMIEPLAQQPRRYQLGA